MRKITVAFICIAVSTVFFSQTAEARTRAYVSIGTPGFCIEASNLRCHPHRTWVECRHHRYDGHRVCAPGRYYARAHERHHDGYYRHHDRRYWQDRDGRGSRYDRRDRNNGNDSPREPRRDRDPGRT